MKKLGYASPKLLTLQKSKNTSHSFYVDSHVCGYNDKLDTMSLVRKKKLLV